MKSRLIISKLTSIIQNKYLITGAIISGCLIYQYVSPKLFTTIYNMETNVQSDDDNTDINDEERKKYGEPHLSKNDKIMFYKYLDNANNYFEYGSGGSTYQASIRKNIKSIYSVESDIFWQKKLKRIINKANISYIFNEMDTQPNTWGNPGKEATNEQKINYSSHMGFLNKTQQKSLDLVLIDGRFRVACCLKCYDIINENCLIAFDDFLNRPQYHIVLKYFDVVEKTLDNRMIILKKKKNMIVPQETIRKYELVKE